MLKRWLKIVISGVLFLLLTACATPGREAFYHGQIAFAHRNYQQAWCYFAKASRYGNSNAYYAIGYMYYYGLYVSQDPVAAINWFRRAAKNHQPQAIATLHHINKAAPTFQSLFT